MTVFLVVRLTAEVEDITATPASEQDPTPPDPPDQTVPTR